MNRKTFLGLFVGGIAACFGLKAKGEPLAKWTLLSPDYIPAPKLPIPIYTNEILIQDERKIQDLVELRMEDAGRASLEWMQQWYAQRLEDCDDLFARVLK